MSNILVGTASWTDKMLVESGLFYPTAVKSPEQDLTGTTRHRHRHRNLIERFFARIEQFHRVATRYHKLASRLKSFVALAASVLWPK